jgi:hypothetical protein
MRSTFLVLAFIVLFALTVSSDFTPSKGPAGASPGGVPSGPTKFIVLSESKGVEKFHVNQTKYVTILNMPEKVERKAQKYSPLFGFIPDNLIPVVASAIGAFFISLLHQFISLGQSYVESTISAKKKKALKIKEHAARVVGIKVREVFSVTAAAFVLGAAISWTYAGPSSDFLWLQVRVHVLVLRLLHDYSHRHPGQCFWGAGVSAG